MRKHGTITRWNDDRGFGFITPSGGTQDVFVHVSAFPRDGRRPQLHELVSYEIEAAPDGRQRAVRIMRPGQARARVPRQSERSQGRWATRILAVGIATLAVFAYDRYSAPNPLQVEPVAESVEPFAELPAPAQRATEDSSSSSCDGRTMCSQMKSCAEATWFIRNCPDTRMDGDDDGVPCETQWCN